MAIPTECFLQKSSQLAVPVVHIPKRGYDVNDMRLVGKILGLFLSKGVDAVADFCPISVV